MTEPLPWFKFHGAAWSGNIALKGCSLAARGLWLELLCMMSSSPERGCLVANGRAVTTTEIAKSVGVGRRQVERLLAELEEAGIVERDFRGAIFSGKLLKDSQTSQKNYENGRKGGNPILIKSNELTSNSTEQPVNPPLNPREDKEKIREESFATLTPRARGRSPKQNGMRPDGREVDAAFERFWLAYPKRVGKGAARTSFARAILKAPIDTIMAAVQSQTFSPDPRYRPAPTTWLNQERWADEAPPDGPVPLDPSSPDPWGVNAWASRQPGSKREAEHWSIAGYYADVVMGHIAEAARIPESWRGNLDSLGDWLRADIPSKQIIAAVKAWAERSGYPSVTTLKFFDSAVRSQGQRRMG